MGLDVGLSEVDRIEVVFEEVNNEDITVELVDNPVTIELETSPEIQVAVNEIYSDVNVILDHDKQINRNLNKQHTAETIQESITKRFTSDLEISNLEPKKGGDDSYVQFPVTPTLNKFLRDDKTFSEVVAGSGGYAANVYFTSLNSDIATYKKISYSLEPSETIISISATNESKLINTYLYDSGVGVTNLDEGSWDYYINCKLDIVGGSNRLKAILFKRSSLGVESDLFTSYSSEIVNTDYLQIRFQNIQSNIPVLTTDRIGVKLYFETTNINPVNLSLIIGDGRASYFTTPLALRHSQLRLPNEDSNVQHLTNAEKNQGALATGNSTLTTLNQVANKAQFAPNENGTVLYHVTKWFTPSGTISTNGTTVTSASAQFTSAMVGAKLTIMGEERIIVAFNSSTVVVVGNAYSQNYSGVIDANWGVYSIAVSIKSGNQSIIIRSAYGDALLINQLDDIFALRTNTISANDNSYAYKSNEVGLGSANRIKVSSTVNFYGTKDLGLRRASAGTWEIFDGITNGVYRDLTLRNLNYYGTLNNASDERLKYDIKPVNKALDKCCAIAECVRHFEFNDQNIYAKGQRTGFIAQLLRDNGFDGHVSEREPNNEEEGAVFGWSYKDEHYEEESPETNEIEVKTRRIIDVKGDMVLQIENNFSPYVYPALAELRKENDLLKDRIRLIEGKLGI